MSNESRRFSSVFGEKHTFSIKWQSYRLLKHTTICMCGWDTWTCILFTSMFCLLRYCLLNANTYIYIRNDSIFNFILDSVTPNKVVEWEEEKNCIKNCGKNDFRFFKMVFFSWYVESVCVFNWKSISGLYICVLSIDLYCIALRPDYY